MQKEVRIKDYFPNDALEIGLWREIDQPSGELHTHDFTEIAIVETGSGTHQFKDKELPVTCGDVFVITPGYPHGWTSTSKLTVINVMIGSEDSIPFLKEIKNHPGFAALFRYEPMMRESALDNERLRLDAKTIRELKAVVSRLQKSLHKSEEHQDISYRALVNAHLLELISILCESYLEEESPINKNILNIAKSIEYIEAHLDQQIQVEELAQMCHLSSSSFYRLFEQAMKTSPINYLNQLRLEKACSLLKNTHKSITEIAFEVGFMDSNYFSRTFKKAIGTSPRDYRNQS